MHVQSWGTDRVLHRAFEQTAASCGSTASGIRLISPGAVSCEQRAAPAAEQTATGAAYLGVRCVQVSNQTGAPGNPRRGTDFSQRRRPGQCAGGAATWRTGRDDAVRAPGAGVSDAADRAGVKRPGCCSRGARAGPGGTAASCTRSGCVPTIGRPSRSGCRQSCWLRPKRSRPF